MPHRRLLRCLPFFLPFGVLLAACGDAEPAPLEPETAPADVETYLGTLPTWAEYAEPVPDADVVASAPSVFEQQGDQFCTERSASITRNPEELVMFSPDSEILWLGSLIQGRSHRDGLGSLLEIPIRQRAPLTVSIDILFSDNQQVVDRPDLASVGQAIGTLIDRAEGAGHSAGSSIFYNQVDSYSFEQATLKIGLSTKYFGPTVRASFDGSRTSTSSSLLARFTQKMFTTSLVLPQSPGALFASDFTPELLQEEIDRGTVGPDNLPVYIASITWGRMLLAEITSTHSADSLKVALSISAANDSLGIRGSYEEILRDSEFKVVAIGGHGQAAIDLIRTGKLDQFFQVDAELTTARPISYVLRNLSDNTIAKVSETTEYNIRECDANGVKHFLNLEDWEDAALGLGLSTEVFPTSQANLVRANELQSEPGANQAMGQQLTFLADSTGLPFSFSLVNRNAGDISDDAIKREGLVYADNELPDHRSTSQRWISIGDTDGFGSDNEWRAKLEDDDFDVRVLGDSPVYAIGLYVGDNDDRAGEHITIEGGDFSFTFDELADIPSEGFVGFVAPFPIERLFFDEDPGGDDIAIRDFWFGIR